MATYAVFFNGVLHSRHHAKGEALDAAYAHVNTAQLVNARHGANGSTECARRADSLGRLLGVLSSRIPDARRGRSSSRYILDEASMGEAVTVRRDEA